MFPEKLPGPGGYVSLGVSWEEGQELPVGFTKVTIGFPRVGVNCASCHTTSVRATPRGKPVFYLGGPSSRYDPHMNPFQRQVTRLPDDHSIGNTDIMAIWNERAHEGYLRHSDDLNTTLVEAARSAALAAGASEKSIDIHSLDRVQAWLMELPSPKFPFSLDASLAARGRPLFDAQCATCHAFNGARTGTVIPVSEIGTDRHRVDHWPKSSAEAFNRYAPGLPWAFHNFCSSNGYVALPLDGIWLRAPYLHNGSVPSLKELLKRPDDRLKVFYRGYDVYDQENVGFVVSGMEAERMGFRYDTSVSGNSNQGHSYGTDLPIEDKQALIEFLKHYSGSRSLNSDRHSI